MAVYNIPSLTHCRCLASRLIREECLNLVRHSELDLPVLASGETHEQEEGEREESFQPTARVRQTGSSCCASHGSSVAVSFAVDSPQACAIALPEDRHLFSDISWRLS